jgi:lysozyme
MQLGDLARQRARQRNFKASVNGAHTMLGSKLFKFCLLKWSGFEKLARMWRNRKMKISSQGEKLIEGFEEFRSKPYQDQRGTWTQGWGHTKGVSALSPECTEAEADDWFDEDLSDVERCIRDHIPITLEQCEYDALCSLIYNIGVGHFLTSALHEKLVSGDKVGASKEFDRWIYCQGKIDNGLRIRRSQEKAIFLADILKRKKVNAI